MVDLPESLLFSSIYLSVLLPDLEHQVGTRAEPYELADSGGATFIPNFLYKKMRLPDDEPPFDLVLNNLSLPEMSELQVIDYLASIQRWLGRSGYFFEANVDHVTFDYRRLVNRNHPDKISSSNPSAAKLAESERRTREVLSAYELLKARRAIR